MTPDEYDSRPGAEPPRTRVYRLTGRYAHLRREDGSLTIECEAALPGPRHDPDTWRGTGDQAEYDKAARLPLCPGCFRARERQLPDPRLGAGHGAVLA